jgi:hypothetical protein
MANVLLTTIEPVCEGTGRDKLNNLKTQMAMLAKRSHQHHFVEHAASADVILLDASFTQYIGYVDLARMTVRRHPLRLKYPEKCFVYDTEDYPAPFVPGVFASLDCRTQDRTRERAGPYVHQLGNALLDPRGLAAHAKNLFSFVGTPSTHPVRREIVKVLHPRGQILVTDGRWPKGRSERDRFKQQYAESIHNSKFVLCPRGRGTSSVRLFEVLQAGRVPVIIADHWVAPEGPQWESCSVRVAENEIGRIPELLEGMESRFEQMAAAARSTFEDWFSEERVLDRIIDSLLELKGQDGVRQRCARVRLARHLCQPREFKRFIVKPMFDRLRGRRIG